MLSAALTLASSGGCCGHAALLALAWRHRPRCTEGGGHRNRRPSRPLGRVDRSLSRAASLPPAALHGHEPRPARAETPPPLRRLWRTADPRRMAYCEWVASASAPAGRAASPEPWSLRAHRRIPRRRVRVRRGQRVAVADRHRAHGACGAGPRTRPPCAEAGLWHRRAPPPLALRARASRGRQREVPGATELQSPAKCACRCARREAPSTGCRARPARLHECRWRPRSSVAAAFAPCLAARTCHVAAAPDAQEGSRHLRGGKVPGYRHRLGWP